MLCRFQTITWKWSDVENVDKQPRKTHWGCSITKSCRCFAIPCNAARQASPSITVSWSLLKLMSIESVMPSNHLSLCCPLLLLPSIFPSIRVFSNESALPISWPKYWSFSFSISPSSEYSGLIFFRFDWFNFLAVQETLKSLLQHHSSKASTLRCSAFFTVQLSHPHMITGKSIPLTILTLVGKVMSLLFNMLSSFVRASQVTLVVKNPTVNAADVRNSRFNPWVRKIPWERAWKPTAVFLPGEFHGQMSLDGRGSQGHEDWDKWSDLAHKLSLQGASVFQFHGCNHQMQWFWSPRK